jgi:hypothetical protein
MALTYHFDHHTVIHYGYPRGVIRSLDDLVEFAECATGRILPSDSPLHRTIGWVVEGRPDTRVHFRLVDIKNRSVLKNMDRFREATGLDHREVVAFLCNTLGRAEITNALNVYRMSL